MSASTGMMPELGSKISLISKADIRYEGRLFTVDPQECTIALANVRSFGTEDRDTPYPIAPQPTVYDYILFRGSDIKDIRVVNNVAIPNDPAIMQMHLPPNQIQPQQQGFPPQNFPPMQPQAGQYAPFSQMQGPPPPVNNPLQNIPQQQQQQQPTQQAISSPNQSQQQQQQQQQQSQSNQQDSRSGTPNARKSPTSDMGVQTNQHREQHAGNKDRMQRNQRNNNMNNMHHNHERRDSGRNDRNERIERNDHRNNDRNNEMYENKGGYRQNNQRMQNQRGGYHNHNNRNNHMRGNQGGSGRMRAPNFYRPNNQNKPNGGGPQNNPGRGNPNNKNTLKFENEFDFEQANSKFEELRTQLAKLKVGTEEIKNPEQVNGEVEKKDDSGNETGADHEVEGDDVIGYDKNKSFFDNISCEASERSKGKQNRPDWRQERKINSETFGLSMNRRGNMRGRGYYRTQYNNRPNYRPGVPPQYRNSNNRNNNNINRNPQNNSSGRTNNPGLPTQQPQQNQQPVAAK